MAKAMAASSGGKKGKGASAAAAAPKNAPSIEDIREGLDDLHTLGDELSTVTASITGKMNKLYESLAVKLGMTKTAVSETYRQERRDRKQEEKALKLAPRDIDSFAMVSQVFGDNTDIGAWAAKMAGIAAKAAKDKEAKAGE